MTEMDLITEGVSCEELELNLVAIGCPVTLEHALVHIKSAIRTDFRDSPQLRHDLDIAHSIIKVLVYLSKISEKS